MHPVSRHLHIRFHRRHQLGHYDLQSLPSGGYQNLPAEHLVRRVEHPLVEHRGRRGQPDAPGAAAASFLDLV